MSFGATHVLHTKIATLLIERFFIQPHCEMPWLSEVPQKCAVGHVGCWLPPKKSCKSCKVLLKTNLEVASTVRRHWSSKTRTPKLYTCRDVIAYRRSDHASTCQRCGFFSCSNYSCCSKPKNALRWTTEPLFIANVGTEHVNAKMTSFWVTSRDHTPPHVLSGS